MISKHSPGGKQKKNTAREAGVEPRGSGPGGVKFFVQINLLFARNLSKCFSILFSAPTEPLSHDNENCICQTNNEKRRRLYLLLSLAQENDNL